MPQLQDELFELENKLLDPDLRRNPDKLASLIADDFLEFGSSGHAYDKKRILFLLKRQMPARLISRNSDHGFGGTGHLPRWYGLISSCRGSVLPAELIMDLA